MKLYTYLFIIVFTACNEPPKNKSQGKYDNPDWRIERKTVQTHAYTNSGLLVSTYKSDSIFFAGNLAAVIKYFIRHSYNKNNNLVKIETFQIPKRNKLDEEKTCTYDDQNNLILEIEKSNDIIDLIAKKEYNTLNQEIKRVEIRRKLEAGPENWNVDSLAAHLNDKKLPPRYDTTIISFSYNEQGKVNEEQYKYPGEEAIQTISTVFNNGERSFIYRINSKGDTTFVTKYEKDGGLTVKINEARINLFLRDTTWYDGTHKIKSVYYDGKMKFADTYKYDKQGYEIENIRYR